MSHGDAGYDSAFDGSEVDPPTTEGGGLGSGYEDVAVVQQVRNHFTFLLKPTLGAESCDLDLPLNGVTGFSLMNLPPEAPDFDGADSADTFHVFMGTS